MQTTDWHEELRLARRGFRRQLFRRGVVSLVLAAVMVAGLSLVPMGHKSVRFWQTRPGVFVQRIEHRYGWPEPIFVHVQYESLDAAGKVLPISLQLPNKGPLLTDHWDLGIAIYMGWGRLPILRMVPTYLVCVALVLAVLTYGPLMAHRQRMRSLMSNCCNGCGYPLHGLPGPRCPECGKSFSM